MRRRLFAAAVATTLAAATALTAAAPASATWSPDGFTAGDLSTWQTNGIAWAVAAAGGEVFVGGTFTSIRPPGAVAGSNEQPALNFATFDAATGAPGACHLGFSNSTGTATVRALNVSADGTTLYVGGSFGSVTYAVNGIAETDSVASMVAIDIASCTRIKTFHPAFSAPVRAIASNSTSVFVGGDFKTVSGLTRNRIAKLSTSGVLDPTWAPAVDLPVRALAIPPAVNSVNDNRLIVGGDFNMVTSSDGTVSGASHALTILTQDTGAIEHLFGSFIESRSVVKSIAVNPDGSAFYTGNEGTGSGAFDGRIAVSLTPPYAQIWRDTCLGATQSVVFYKGVIYGGSHSHDCSLLKEFGNGQRQHLVAELANPPAATSAVPQPQLLPWYPNTNDGIGEMIGPRQLTVANSSTGDFLWVVGEFTTVNGKAQQGLTRFGTGPDTTAPTAPALSVKSYRAGQVQVRFRAGTDTDDGTLTYAVYRDGGATPSWTGQLTSSWWRRPQMTVLDTQTAGTTHTYSVTVSDGTFTTPKAAATAGVTVAGVQPSYDNTVNADSPALHWRMDEKAGTFAADSAISASTPVNNNATYPYPAATTMTYNQPGALLNDTGNTAIGLTGTANLYSEQRQPSPAASFSEEAWIKTSTKTGGKIVGFGDAQVSLSVSNDRSIIMLNNGQLQFNVYAGARKVVTSPAAYNNGQWHYVVATQSAAGMKLYVDKVLVASSTVRTAYAYPNGGYWRVGGDNVTGWPSAPTSTFFQGTIDEVAVYNTALSATQITNHWKASGRN